MEVVFSYIFENQKVGKGRFLPEIVEFIAKTSKNLIFIFIDVMWWINWTFFCGLSLYDVKVILFDIRRLGAQWYHLTSWHWLFQWRELSQNKIFIWCDGLVKFSVALDIYIILEGESENWID